MEETKSMPTGIEVIVPLSAEYQSCGILSQQDLIGAWKLILRATNATYVEVDPDELLYGLIDVTQTHYTQMDVKNPQTKAQDNFCRTRWAWKRLKEKVEKRRLEQKNALLKK